MRPDARAYLWDVQKAADAILGFVAGLDAQSYAETALVHSAVERKFEIIGEALGKLSKVNPSLASRIPDIRTIIAFRNILVHGYATIEHDRVWHAATDFLPELRSAVVNLLTELGPP